ncbi:MAG: helix-turn-helix transcriptional regulator [Bacillus sp. (in: Bacteria)]|nr:helix-turn-helix transcriptional regulator [Bacillus sp. (in: firmicutes)]
MENNDQQPNFDEVFADLVGKVIRKYRIKQGMTPEELAKSSRLTTEQINQIEQGKVDLEILTFYRIIHGLGYESPETIFNEIDEIIEPHLIKEIEMKKKG